MADSSDSWTGRGTRGQLDAGDHHPEHAETAKRRAAERAAELVEAGMTVGLGTGSTVAYLLPALAGRRLDLTCVATSPTTEQQARALGLRVRANRDVAHLDIAIDGADQVSPDYWLVKGGGGAHTREKVVAAATERFVVIVSPGKLVDALTAPVPLELLEFGLAGTLRRLGPCRLRAGSRSPDGGIIVDWLGEVGDPGVLAARLDADPGVVSHGLFPPEMVTDLVVGEADGARLVRRGSDTPRRSGV